MQQSWTFFTVTLALSDPTHKGVFDQCDEFQIFRPILQSQNKTLCNFETYSHQSENESESEEDQGTGKKDKN